MTDDYLNFGCQSGKYFCISTMCVLYLLQAFRYAWWRNSNSELVSGWFPLGSADGRNAE